PPTPPLFPYTTLFRSKTFEDSPPTNWLSGNLWESLGISGNLTLWESEIDRSEWLPYGLAQLERVLIQNSRWPASPPAFREFCMRDRKSTRLNSSHDQI